MSERAVDRRTLRLATFGVGADLFAVDIMRIREITRPLPVTAVPRAPVGMVGVVEVSDGVIPVFDLRARFGLPARQPHTQSSSRYVHLRLDGRVYALVVDSVEDVFTVERGQIRSGPGVLIGDAADAFHGVCAVGDRLALLLNLRRIIERHDRLLLDDLLPPSAPAQALRGSP
jgi:purine-binding chemotaxis protein CheW